MIKRFKYIYKIKSCEDILNKLLYISNSVQYINILVSNSEFQSNILPKDYVNYDLIAGVDSLISFKIKQKLSKIIKGLSQYK